MLVPILHLNKTFSRRKCKKLILVLTYGEGFSVTFGLHLSKYSDFFFFFFTVDIYYLKKISIEKVNTSLMNTIYNRNIFAILIGTD